MYKIKTNWYHTLGPNVHRYTKTKHNNEKFIWEQVLTHKYDDMKAFIGDKQEWMDTFADDLLSNIVNIRTVLTNESKEKLGEKITKEVQSIVDDIEVDGEVDRKEFGKKLLQTQPDKLYHPLYWDALNKKDVWECASNLVLRNLKSNFEVATKLAGGIQFKDYKPK